MKDTIKAGLEADLKFWVGERKNAEKRVRSITAWLAKLNEVKSVATATPNIPREASPNIRLDAAKRLLKSEGVRFYCDKNKNGRSLKPVRRVRPAIANALSRLADETVKLPVHLRGEIVPGRVVIRYRFLQVT